MMSKPFPSPRSTAVATRRQTTPDRSPPRKGTKTNSPDWRLVHQVTATIIEMLPQRLSLDQAAKVLGVPPLQVARAFARVRVHPRRHIRERRLWGVRDLLSSPSFEGTVDEAIQLWGFPLRSEPMHIDYRRMFGERPADTWSRTRQAVLGHDDDVADEGLASGKQPQEPASSD